MSIGILKQHFGRAITIRTQDISHPHHIIHRIRKVCDRRGSTLRCKVRDLRRLNIEIRKAGAIVDLKRGIGELVIGSLLHPG